MHHSDNHAIHCHLLSIGVQSSLSNMNTLYLLDGLISVPNNVDLVRSLFSHRLCISLVI